MPCRLAAPTIVGEFLSSLSRVWRHGSFLPTMPPAATRIRGGHVKIIDIKTWALRCPIAEPFAFSQGWVHERGATIVEVITDAGLSGWGEALCQGLQPPEVAAAAVDAVFRPLLLGQDASRP